MRFQDPLAALSWRYRAGRLRSWLRYRFAKPLRYRFGSLRGLEPIGSPCGYRLGTTPNGFSRRFAWQRKGWGQGRLKNSTLKRAAAGGEFTVSRQQLLARRFGYRLRFGSFRYRCTPLWPVGQRGDAWSR